MATADVTLLLQRIAQGDKQAEAVLIPQVYKELHKIALANLRRERPDHTLQATALVHEAYLRLTGQRDVDWKSRAHFFGIAAQVMRRILVDYARTRKAAKRGGSIVPVSLDSIVEPGARESWDKILDVHEALSRLAAVDPRPARVVELRFFGGLEIQEIADLLSLSTRTVKRDWEFAQSWLFANIAESYGNRPKPGKMSPPSARSRV